MSRYVATRAIRGANAIVAEADALLQKALAERGADQGVAFPNTAYFLPVAASIPRMPATRTCLGRSGLLSDL